MTRAACGRSAKTSVSRLGPTTVKLLEEYLWQSTLPLTTLLFLLPAIVLYEMGTRWFALDVVRQTETRVLAFNLMQQFLGLFGASGRYLPCLAVVGILLAWHIARQDPWKLQVGTAMGMLVESALLAFPLLALSGFLGSLQPLAAVAGGWRSGVVLSIGAGVYEELVFRLGAFTVLNIVLVDLLRIEKRWAWVLIIVGSAILFSAYHHWTPNSPPFRAEDFVFRSLCGLYFGVLFISRGFGITAGAHMCYDLYYFLLRPGGLM